MRKTLCPSSMRGAGTRTCTPMTSKVSAIAPSQRAAPRATDPVNAISTAAASRPKPWRVLTGSPSAAMTTNSTASLGRTRCGASCMARGLHPFDGFGLALLLALAYRGRRFAQLRQDVFGPVGGEQRHGEIGADELEPAHVVEQRAERIPELRDVQDQDRFLVAAELRPGELLHQFFQGPDAAGQRHERVGALEHGLLAHVHVGRNDDFLRTLQGLLAVLQELGNDAGDAAAV